MYVCMYINNIFIVYDKGWDWVVYFKSVENVITLGKLIGLLFLFCLPLLSILFLKTKRNDLARPVMGTIFLVYYLQEPTDIPSRKKLMRSVCARVGMSEEGVYCKIIFL